MTLAQQIHKLQIELINSNKTVEDPRLLDLVDLLFKRVTELEDELENIKDNNDTRMEEDRSDYYMNRDDLD